MDWNGKTNNPTDNLLPNHQNLPANCHQFTANKSLARQNQDIVNKRGHLPMDIYELPVIGTLIGKGIQWTGQTMTRRATRHHAIYGWLTRLPKHKTVRNSQSRWSQKIGTQSWSMNKLNQTNKNQQSVGNGVNPCTRIVASECQMLTLFDDSLGKKSLRKFTYISITCPYPRSNLMFWITSHRKPFCCRAPHPEIVYAC